MDRNRVLELALESLNRKRAGIDEEIETLQNELEGTGTAIREMTSPVTRRGRKRTAAERKAQAQRMRKYWAEKRALAAKPAAAVKKPFPASAKVRTMTAAHKKALSLKMKQVWRKRRAAAGKKAK